MTPYLEPSVTACQELIVPAAVDTIGSMTEHLDLEQFSARMNELCDDKGLPNFGRQSELAKLFGVSQKGARKWLQAESFPRWEHIIAITNWAGVTIEWLMAGRGPKRLDDLYDSPSIARVANMMRVMEPEQQYLVARLADQVAQPASSSEQDGDESKPVRASGQ